MYPFTTLNLTAGGNILPNRFLTPTGSGNSNFLSVVQASGSSALLVGISGSGVRGPQPAADNTGNTNSTTYLAQTGDPVPASTALTEGQLLLGVGTTVNNWGVPLTSDASGAGTPFTPVNGTTSYWGAIAMQPGIGGDIIAVWVLPPSWNT